MKVLRTMAAAMLIALGSGCSLFTGPQPLLDQFTWEMVDNQSDITEGVSIAALFGDISFLGQVKTPTLCYSVTSKLETDDFDITIRVDITASGSGTCAQQSGGVRYSGAVMNLSDGTYTVRIIQTVSGVGTQEFVQEVRL
jgi:hypothetical protein